MIRNSAAVVIIGDEILCGSTKDTNSQFLVERLTQLGVEVKRILVLPDEIDVLVSEISRIKDEFEFVITTGGIGPTHDDLTREAIAQVTNRKIVFNEEAAKAIEEAYEKKPTETQLIMAYLPEGCRLIGNKQTGAPGFIVDNIYVFPGIPRLLHAMFELVEDELRRGSFFEERISVLVGESKFAHILREARDKFPYVKIGSYPKYEDIAWVEVRIRGRDESKVKECASWLEPRLKEVEAQQKPSKET